MFGETPAQEGVWDSEKVAVAMGGGVPVGATNRQGLGAGGRELDGRVEGVSGEA